MNTGTAAELVGTPTDTITGRGADLLVESLVRAGVRELFGLPGDTGVVLYDALHRRAGDIRHVLARDERHAAYMADAYARVTGRAGVVEVSSGGGVTYVVGGLGEALAAGVPLLVITSDIHTGSRGGGALTEIDQPALFAAVTKRTFVVTDAAEIPGAVEDALRAATSGRPGPVAVIVPEDVLDEKATAELSPPRDRLAAPAVRRPAADVSPAVRALESARRPALLVGGGAHFSRCYAGIAALADRLGAGVATTIHGKGAIADDSPWALGVAGNNGGSALANEYLAASDVVLVVGSRANATDTDSFTAPPRSATVIAVDVDPSRVLRNYPDALPLAGDAATVLDQILTDLSIVDTGATRRDDIAARRARTTPETPAVAPPGTLPVGEVIAALADVIADADPIVVVDPGAPTPAVADGWPVREAGRRIVVPRGHGPMGYAIPAAVGAAVARPGRPVLALTADGSFAMSCGELETIARLGLPVIAVQLTNHSLGWIKMLQHLYQDRRYFGVDPGPIDAVAVARACGLSAARPESVADLRERVRTALRENTALYLDVEVPHMIDAVPQVPAWHRALSGDRTRPVY
ncbi:thiamine pyrophosphate-binding protein [Pseudonocardia acaciae]|uniref:thiamine pyrophosphate-binding protein n=1 Tax=Pseudonocardia acaciae TaxID=551276 RepID=UPI000B06C1FF|nr:thiamine pyrophosphate-binding protein [Pseudonocardia acaciae]